MCLIFTFYTILKVNNGHRVTNVLVNNVQYCTAGNWLNYKYTNFDAHMAFEGLLSTCSTSHVKEIPSQIHSGI